MTLDLATDSQIHHQKYKQQQNTDRLDFIKIKIFCKMDTTVNGNPNNGRKYLQIICMG